MKFARLAAGASVTALALFASACGGGGGGPPVSTPAPTPTPAPGSTPSPEPNGGPPPPQSGASLVNPQVAATYFTAGTTVSGVLNADGQVSSSGTTGSTDLSISYDPASDSYGVRRAGQLRNFTASQYAATEVGPRQRVTYDEFVSNVPGGTENLFVSQMPSQSLQRLNWVGHGLLIHQATNGSNYDVFADGFYFGLPTSAAGVPISGTVEYSVRMRGVRARQGFTPEVFKGDEWNGLLSANFGSGQIQLSGNGSARNLVGSGGGGFFNYSGVAQISSGGGFSGSFTLAGTAGSWSGAFFGPQAEEVGAAFRSNGGSVSYAGALVGSSDPEFVGIEKDMLSLDNITGFDAYRLEAYQHLELATGKTTNEGGQVWPNFLPAAVRYDPEGETWTLANTFSHGALDYDASQSDAAYSVYGDVTVDENGTNGLRLLRPGADNPAVALSYMSLGVWEVSTRPSDGSYEVQRNYVVFGIPTRESSMPVSGSASYSGRLYGIASSINGGDDYFYSLDGTSSLFVDFGTSLWSGSLHPTGSDRNGAGARDFGAFAFADARVTGAALDEASLSFGASPDVGTIVGHFFGDRGAEVGGGFGVDMEDPERPGYQLLLDGLFLGKQD